MARMPSRFISPLSDDDRSVLEYLKDHGETPAIRQRAHAILLSETGHSMKQIAAIFSVSIRTVMRWLDRWEEGELSGLKDDPRSGAPPKLTADEVRVALDIVENESPHSPKHALELIKGKTGKVISRSTLKRLLRKAGLSWKRMRRSVKSKRDEQKFEAARKDLADFMEAHIAGEFQLFYCDESGFSLTPTVPYAWQKIGTTTELPSFRSRRLNTLGFLRLDNHFQSYTVEGNIDSEIVVNCVDDFCDSLTGPAIVVIDNASMHTSRRFESQIPRWEERGLFFYFLPPYCPELNLIETLWRMIKHHWLPLDAYTSFSNLASRLADVLSKIGSTFVINHDAANSMT